MGTNILGSAKMMLVTVDIAVARPVLEKTCLNFMNICKMFTL